MPPPRFVVANVLWDLDRDASLALHLAVGQELPKHPEVPLELGLQHTRRGQCAEANRAWSALEALCGLHGPMTGIAAYCQLAVNHKAAAQQPWQRAGIGRQHIALEKLLHTVSTAGS